MTIKSITIIPKAAGMSDGSVLPAGPSGPAPGHRFQGNFLQFQNPDGSWDDPGFDLGDLEINFDSVVGKPSTLQGYGIVDGAPLASPTFTGSPAAPTPATSDNSATIATTAMVTAAVAAALANVQVALEQLGLTGLPRSYIDGFKLANSTGDATNDIVINDGVCRDRGGTDDIVGALKTKRLDAGWSVGDGNGFLDIGTIANEIYYAYAIKRSDTKVVDYIASQSPDVSATITMTIASPAVVTWVDHSLRAGARVNFTNVGGALPTGVTAGTDYYVLATSLAKDSFRFSASQGGAAINSSGSQSGTHTGTSEPLMPTSYDRRRYLGSFQRASAAILPFRHLRGTDFYLVTPIHTGATTIGSSRYTWGVAAAAGTCPPNMRAKIRLYVYDAASNTSVVYGPTFETDAGPNGTVSPGIAIRTEVANQGVAAEPEVELDAASQFYLRGSTAGTIAQVVLRGWVDTRRQNR